MTTTVSDSPRSLKPSTGRCKWVRRPDLHAPGVLLISGIPYSVSLIPAPGGKISGYRIVNTANGKLYDLPADLSGCDCPDREFRPHRPGGCKHMRALRASLRREAGKPVQPVETVEVEAEEAQEAKERSLLKVLVEEGWQRGAPDHVSLDTRDHDGHTAARMICDQCGRKGLAYFAFQRNGGYRAVGRCRCGACVEL